MAGVTPGASLPYPELGDEPNIEFTVKPLAEELDTKVVPRFATSTERDTAIPTPIDGQLCFVTTYGLMVRTESAWLPQAGIEVCRLVMASDTTATNNVDLPIPFAAGSQTYLPFGGHSTTVNNTRFVPPFPGRYQAYGNIGWFQHATGMRLTSIHKNGSAIAGGATRHLPGVALQCAFSASATFTANGSTDYIQLVAQQSSGGSLNTMSSASVGSYGTCLSVVYLGPELG